MFEIHIIPTKWGWPDLLQHSDNPIYTERERPMFEIHIIPTKWGWSDLLQHSDNPIYTERERPMFEIHIIPTKWGWPDLLQHSDNPIYTERDRCLKSILSPPNEVGRIYFNIVTIPYIERERPMFEIHIIPTKWGWPDLLQHSDNPIYTERDRCLKSIVFPPNEVGRIYFNIVRIPYI